MNIKSRQFLQKKIVKDIVNLSFFFHYDVIRNRNNLFPFVFFNFHSHPLLTYMFYVYRGIGDSWFFNFTKTFFLSCNILYQFFPANALGWLISTHCRFKTVNAISILSEVLKVKKNSVVFDEIINKKNVTFLIHMIFLISFIQLIII